MQGFFVCKADPEEKENKEVDFSLLLGLALTIFLMFNMKPKYYNMNTTTIIGIVALICAIWVIYDVWAKQKKMSGGNKVLWTILALIFNILTAIIYYFVKKK